MLQLERQRDLITNTGWSDRARQEDRLPVWASIVVIVGFSAFCYWLVYLLLSSFVLH